VSTIFRNESAVFVDVWNRVKCFASSITDSTDRKIDYADSLTYNPAIIQIDEPVMHTGNLRRLIDPTNAAQRASIIPDTSETPWYCKNAGCDYTLKVTFNDAGEQFVALQSGFRGWFDAAINPKALNPLEDSSYRVWGVNVPAAKSILKLELLETPEVWKGLSISPKVVASRTIK
jgi:hypothetical protein